MHVHCEQHDLVSALQAFQRIALHDRGFLQELYLHVDVSRTSGPGRLALIGSTLQDTVGLVRRIPAQVMQAGTARVSLDLLVPYISMMRPGPLTLRQEQAVLSAGKKRPQEAPYLCLEYTRSERDGQVSTHRARFKIWTDLHYYVPPIREWTRAATSVTSFRAADLREAALACAPFANERQKSKDEHPEMYGILLSGKAGDETLHLTAVTATMATSHRVRLTRPLTCSVEHTVLGKALACLSTAFDAEDQITLRLVPDEEPEPVLLFSTPQMLWFCHCLTGPQTRQWRARLEQPHEMECSVRRADLLRSLRFLAALPHKAYPALRLCIQRTTLQLEALAKDPSGPQPRQEIPLLDATQERELIVQAPLLKRLVNRIQDEVLHLQMGHFTSSTQEGPEVRHFLRASSAQATVLMSCFAWEQEAADLPEPAYPAAVAEEQRGPRSERY